MVDAGRCACSPSHLDVQPDCLALAHLQIVLRNIRLVGLLLLFQRPWGGKRADSYDGRYIKSAPHYFDSRQARCAQE